MKSLVAAAIASACAMCADGAESVFKGGFWIDDGFYGKGRQPQEEIRATPDKAPEGFRLRYHDVAIPDSGWYRFRFCGVAPSSFAMDYIVDGELAAFAAPMGRTSGMTKGECLGPCLWLERGRRELGFDFQGRRSFPLRKFDSFALETTDDALLVEKAGHDVVRLGTEKMKIRLCGTGPQRIEIKIAPQCGGGWTLAGVANLRPGKKVETFAEIDFPAEGMYFVKGWRDGKELPENEFPKMEAVAVDVRAKETRPSGSFDAVVPVCEIDCTAKAPDFEAKGVSVVSERGGLRYRETSPAILSGFSYRVNVPEAQVPYLLEWEIPDDDRRVATFRHDWLSGDGSAPAKGNGGYQTKGTETGGFYPLSGKTVVQAQIVWPLSTNGIVSVMNLLRGARAAASKMRISRFPGDVVPSLGTARPGGRMMAYWEEEGDNYGVMIGAGGMNGTGSGSGGTGAARGVDYLGKADRFMRMIRANGGNAVSGVGIAYQMASWRTRALRRSLAFPPFSKLRLMALLAEKHGMAFCPEWFNPGHPLQATRTVWQFEGEPCEETQSLSAPGLYPVGTVGDQAVNPLSPSVQKSVLDGMREIAGEIGDSPAFAGVAFRVDRWQFSGEFCFRSLQWGYNDSVVRAFAGETGIAVPDGPASDRYAFLTQGDSSVREAWIRWRCGRIAAYYAKIVEILRCGGMRPDVKLVVAGQLDQEGIYPVPEAPAVRSRESGLDLENLPDGMEFLPAARYGCRPWAAARNREVYDGFFSSEFASLGRGFAAYMDYRELASKYPAAELGLPYGKERKPPYHCSAVLAAGRGVLEKFAAVLGENDVNILRDGGNCDCFGDPRVVGPWFAEYERIPDIPFERVPGANDPVAVWHAETDGRYWRYLVNKESFPTVATIVWSDGSEETVKLQPWDLRVTDSRAGTRRIVSARSIYPEDKVAEIRDALEAARKVAGATGKAKVRFERAESAAKEGKWWRVRAELSSAPVLEAFALSGEAPQVLYRAPNGKGFAGASVDDRWKCAIPGMKPIPGDCWLVAGSFDSPCMKNGYNGKTLPAVFAALEKRFRDGGLEWHGPRAGFEDVLHDRGMYVSQHLPGARQKDAWIAKTTVVCDRAREVRFCGAVDWYGKLLVNGEPLMTDSSGKSGQSFETSTPKYSGVATLNKGANEIVLLGQSGSMGAAFAMWITDDPGVKVMLPGK